MFQLILLVIAIGLTGLLAVVSINYLPWWQKGADISEKAMTRSLDSIEKGFDAITQANDGVEPVPLPTVDGGLMSHFRPVLGYTPAAVPGYTWRYGEQADASHPLYGLKYFCMHPINSDSFMTEPSLKGVMRAKARFSEEQVTLGYGCGTTALHPKANTSLTLTFYVKAALSSEGLVQ